MITTSPIISCTSSMIRNEDILMIVEISIFTILDAVNHSRLEVDQQCSWYVVLIISLIEKHIFPVTSLNTHFKLKQSIHTHKKQKSIIPHKIAKKNNEK
jgi:hypothetical protein